MKWLLGGRFANFLLIISGLTLNDSVWGSYSFPVESQILPSALEITVVNAAEEQLFCFFA